MGWGSLGRGRGNEGGEGVLGIASCTGTENWDVFLKKKVRG